MWHKLQGSRCGSPLQRACSWPHSSERISHHTSSSLEEDVYIYQKNALPFTPGRVNQTHRAVRSSETKRRTQTMQRFAGVAKRQVCF